MNINEQIRTLPNNELLLQCKQVEQIIEDGVFGVNDLQISQAMAEEIKRRKIKHNANT